MSFLSRSRGAEVLPPLPYEPSSAPGLAARWVQWVAASGPIKNPLDDATGEYAGLNQPDDVWFLAGSYGKRMHRRCAVPAGRPLFLPAFNTWYWPTDVPPLVMEDAHGSLTVDGAAVQLQEIGTPVPFVVAGARLNGVTNTRKPVPATVWGLWGQVPPLEPGGHELHVTGGDGYGFEVDVTYSLVVGGVTPAYPGR
ncbi:UNVERIFIED_ORG: hypothetical protein E4P37_06220 [Bacillus sp. AZ43]